MSQLHMMSWGDPWEYIQHKDSAHFTNTEYLWWKKWWYELKKTIYSILLYTGHNHNETLINQPINS